MFTIERVATDDGALLAAKRYATPDAPPVILLHGLAVSADIWDLPSVTEPDFEYHSLRTMLHAAGFDVWLANLRGHGDAEMHSKPPEAQTDWCVDHFILHDLPALVRHVRETTGRPPFLIGSSMGAMTISGYVQGARWEGAPGTGRIIADAELAARRATDVAGAVFVEFPAALRWPASMYDEQGSIDWTAFLRDWRRTDGDVNFPFEWLARSDWLCALVRAAGKVPLDAFRKRGEPWWRRLPDPWPERFAELQRRTTQATLNFTGKLAGFRNHRAEVLVAGRRNVVAHMKAGVLDQMAQSVRARGFVSLLGTPRHIYSDHYKFVHTPYLAVVGGCDRIANADVTREVFHERAASTDKTLLLFEEIAHGEFEVAPIATEKVFPAIRAWLSERSKANIE